MPPPIPSIGALRALRASIHLQVQPTTQIRHATLLRRPKRPYTFTQLVTLSDGSAFTLRTTSPQPVYTSAKDIRNTALWNPSLQRLLNVEEDEAGKLASFRSKFGRGWDAEEGEKVSLFWFCFMWICGDEGFGREWADNVTGRTADRSPYGFDKWGQGKGKGKKGSGAKAAAGAPAEEAAKAAAGTPAAAPAKPAEKK